MTRKPFIPAFLLLFCVVRAIAAEAATQPGGTVAGVLEVDRVEDRTVYFKAPAGTETPKPLKTDLYELKSLGAIRASEGGPAYFVFSGRPCENCLHETGIYIFRPNGGKPSGFVYPGRILEPRSRAVLHESRAFIGKCLRSREDVYVVFQKERVDRRRSLQTSVFVAEPATDHLQERLIERGLPRLDYTLRRVRQKECREIDGRNRLMLSKPLDLNPRNGADDSDSDDEPDSPRENQTDHDLLKS